MLGENEVRPFSFSLNINAYASNMTTVHSEIKGGTVIILAVQRPKTANGTAAAAAA